MKVHIGRVHTNKCETCNEKFTSKDKFERHRKLNILLDNLGETKSGDYGLEIIKHRNDELCLAVVSQKEVRDDGLPLLYLHSLDCWNRSGHVCPDLPPDAHENLLEDFALDYNVYDPTRVGYSPGRWEESSQEILKTHRKFRWKITHFVVVSTQE